MCTMAYRGASGGGMTGRCKITVRHGAALAHVPTVEAAATLVQRLAAARPEQQLGALEVEAKCVLLGAVEAAQLLGGATVTRG